MQAKTTAQRQADYKARRKDAGLVLLTQLWVHPDDVQPIRAYAAKLRRKRAKEDKPPPV